MNIDGNLELEVSKFEFNKEVTQVFDSHVRKSVPMYEELHNMVKNISTWYIKNNTNVYDIGSSTGEGIKELIELHEGKGVEFIGIDQSKHMTDEASSRFKNNNNVSFINGDVMNNNIKINNSSFIISILTIQFIEQQHRQEIINKIYKGLNKGGAFILVEKVIGNTANFDEIFIEMYHDFKKEQGFSEEEIFAKARTLRGVMQPYTIQENIDMLEEAGFKHTDVFFKWCNFTGIVAIK